MRPITIIKSHNQAQTSAEAAAGTIADRMGFAIDRIDEAECATLDEWVESHDSALVVIGVDSHSRLQRYLDLTRGLRVPYIFVKPGQQFVCSVIGMGITRFEEDKEKGPYCGSLARYFGSRILIYRPHDYGTAAGRNIDAIAQLLRGQGLTPEIVDGRHDSSAIEAEAAHNTAVDLLIISASRDYGLDDIIFGPKERKIISRATVPVLVVNPRGDLYPLCD